MTIQCAVPFVTGFNRAAGGFRNCCMTDPPVESQPNQTWQDWWNGQQLSDFRQRLTKDTLPDDCRACQLQETLHHSSFRTAVNQTVDLHRLEPQHPRNWNVIFGNVCNLACWTCNENGSSVIESHKRRLNILPKTFESPQARFDRSWPDLETNIMASYDHHDTVGLTILGGEPLYNVTVLGFLESLIQRDLAKRTRLEFHTNATQINPRVEKVMSKGQWQYVSIFLSLDAVGPKAEWLRYGCQWSKIEHNIPVFRSLCDHIEVQCTVSILNVRDLPSLKTFCAGYDLPLVTHALARPEYMCLANWDQDPASLVSVDDLAAAGFSHYFAEIGQRSSPGTRDQLVDYIRGYDAIRSPLVDHDPVLANILGMSTPHPK